MLLLLLELLLAREDVGVVLVLVDDLNVVASLSGEIGFRKGGSRKEVCDKVLI